MTSNSRKNRRNHPQQSATDGDDGANKTAESTADDGGSGGTFGLTRSDGVMERRAIREGWIGSRFPTRTPVSEIESEGADTIAKRLALSVARGLESPDERRQGIAEKTALAMEVANQRDEHKMLDHADGKGDGDDENSGTLIETIVVDTPEEAKRLAGYDD